MLRKALGGTALLVSAVALTTVLTGAAAPAASGSGPANESPGRFGTNVVFTMYSAPVSGTYVVGHIDGTTLVQHYECVGGWRHIRTPNGVGGSHHQNTVAWIFNGC